MRWRRLARATHLSENWNLTTDDDRWNDDQSLKNLALIKNLNVGWRSWRKSDDFVVWSSIWKLFWTLEIFWWKNHSNLTFFFHFYYKYYIFFSSSFSFLLYIRNKIEKVFHPRLIILTFSSIELSSLSFTPHSIHDDIKRAQDGRDEEYENILIPSIGPSDQLTSNKVRKRAVNLSAN